MAGDLAGAPAMLSARSRAALPTGIDFNFTRDHGLARAKEMLDDGAIGALRHVTVHWHVENRVDRGMRCSNWKTSGGNDGGGVLGNFISHWFHYLEWFVGPIAGLSARVCPDCRTTRRCETTVAMALRVRSPARRSACR